MDMADFAIENRYEYDAPTYVDFELLRQGDLDDNDVDQWFETKGEDDDSQNTFADSFVPPSEVLQVKTETDNAPSPPQPPVVMATVTAPKKEPGGEEKGGNVKVQKQMKILSKLHKGLRTRKGGGETVKGPLRAVHSQIQKERRPAAVKATAAIKSFLNKSCTPKSAKPPSPKQKPVELTMPQTPEVLRKHPARRTQGVTSEELELQEIELLKKEAKKRLRMSRRSYQRLAHTSAPVPVKGSKPTTEALEPRLRAMSRDRGRSGSQYNGGINPTNFPMTLRSSCKEDNFHPCMPSTKPPTPDGVTKVKPFKFELDSRFQTKGKGKSKPTEVRRGKEVPTAEAVLKFQNTTPERFHSNPAPASKPGSGMQRNASLTMPKTPNLLTKGRSRPVTAKSQAEREEEEMEEIKGYQFKATRLNPEIFTRGGLYGVPNRRTEAFMTVPESPHLATRERSQQRKGGEEEEEDEKHPVFVARPMPKEIFEKVRGVPEKRPRPITFPESPALKRRRIEEPREDKEEEIVSLVIKANPMPDFDRVFKPQLPHTATETLPFMFEERYKDKPSRETLVQQILQKEKKAHFKAQLMPEFGTPQLPTKSVQPPVNLKPFNLHTELRGQQYTSKWIEKLAEEAEQTKRAAEFHAQEAAVLSVRPFVPLKSAKPLTDLSNAVLHSEIRHEQRAKYEAERKERDTAKELEKQEMDALREAEEVKRLAEHRRTLVHRAQPIHHYAPVAIKPSDRTLTDAISPVFLTDMRLRGSGQLKTDV